MRLKTKKKGSLKRKNESCQSFMNFSLNSVILDLRVSRAILIWAISFSNSPRTCFDSFTTVSACVAVVLAFPWISSACFSTVSASTPTSTASLATCSELVTDFSAAF
jgi:hypothetical protein